MATLLDEFDSMNGVNEDFCKELEALVMRIIQANCIAVHSITSRKKSRESLIKKINKKVNEYRGLSDITDVVGIRIITYFSDQVDAVSELIENEFEIDVKNSVDKRASLESDRFGYLSRHYVVSLPETRCKLTENKRFKGCKAEIQIRSILQHAWAEIEHDLGYKTNGEIPATIRRQFARLSGLLELGDKEFVDIRDKLLSYTKTISTSSNEDLEPAQIDKVTLNEFVKREPLVGKLDLAIATALKRSIATTEPDMSNDIERLNYLKIFTLAELKESFNKYHKGIVKLANLWGEEVDEDDEDALTFSRGISIYYLCHLLAGASQDEGYICGYYQRFNIGLDEDINDTISQVMRVAKAT